MQIRFIEGNYVEIDECRITWKNFSGMNTDFPNPDNRGFAVVIPDPEVGEELLDRGWNVVVKPPIKDGDPDRYYLPVKFNYKKGFEPDIEMRSGRKRVELTEQTVDKLDRADIVSVSLDVKKSNWENRGRAGVTNYLQCMKAVLRVNRFAAEYEEEMEDDIPFAK